MARVRTAETVRDSVEAAPGIEQAVRRAVPLTRVRRSVWPSLLLMTGLLVVVVAVAVSQGPVGIPLGTVWRVLLAHTTGIRIGAWPASAEAIVWEIRLPRVVLAGTVGATLACSGAGYQGVFRNPLADPYLIGVASGAGLGAAVAIISPLRGSWHGLSPLPLFAFVGAMTTVSISYAIARSGRAIPLATLILAGVAVSALANAAMSFLFMIHNEKFLTVFAWLLGGFNASSWLTTVLVLPYVVAGSGVVLVFARILNVLQFGEEQAQQLGVPVERVKLVVLIAASLATAAAVSVSGLIGFVGLIVPHAIRLVWGPDYRRIVPFSIVLGAIFMILADLFARLIIAPQEMPIGIVTAFCGAPFFLYLLKRGRRSLFL
ncbi:MAG: FecCD family ABC transporter permease [Dehalococcoidia bacterium]